MEQLPAGRREGLIVEELDGELLLYDTERERAHSLNAVAAAVWEACDGVRGPKAIAEAAGVTEDAVWRALSQLEERRLLDGELPRRMSGPEYSRRQAVRRMGLIGASAAFAAPFVRSIVVPDPAQAGGPAMSCVPLNAQCGTLVGGEGCDTSTFPPCCPAMNVFCVPDEGGTCSCTTTS
jgi:Coenzyme PQQ synthesis protein D (PqqD)